MSTVNVRVVLRWMEPEEFWVIFFAFITEKSLFRRKSYIIL